MEINIVGCKDLPVQSNSNFEPVYVKFQFFDQTVIETPG